ncbi:hypothetical protein HK405_007699, partial [Cladochytrium tenue]
MRPLLLQGFRKPLAMDDLYPLADRYRCEQLADDFERRWTESLRKDSKEPPTVRGVLFAMFARQYLPVGLIKFVGDIGNALSPLALQALIAYVSQSAIPENAPPMWLGIVYAVVLFVLNSTASMCIAYYYQRATAYGITVRGLLTAVAYRKSLRLSGASRRIFNNGRITNIISSDLPRLEQLLMYFHLFWTYPLQIIVILGLLIHELGAIAALSGVFVLVLVAPLQARIVRGLVRLRARNASSTDKRVRWTAEVLAASRVVRFFAWEDAFEKTILAAREVEMKAVTSSNLLRSVVTASGFAIPVVAAAVSFTVYAAMSPTFDSVIIFAALASFNQLRNPVMLLPQMISTYADASVALRRVQELLDSTEQDFHPSIDANMIDNGLAVSVRNGSFVWDDPADLEKLPPNGDFLVSKETETIIGADPVEPSKPRLTLRDIELAIPSGALVAIVGSVGSGKSSLLSALVGELQPAAANASVSLASAPQYAPQQPWMLNATVRDNVLFNRPFNKTAYARCLAACALERDLSVLPGGDRAEIGERGINLSGGQKQRVSLARVAYGAALAIAGNERLSRLLVLLDDPLSALHLVPECDMVITLKDGAIAECGSYAELMAANAEFASLMRSHTGASDPTDNKMVERDAIGVSAGSTEVLLSSGAVAQYEDPDELLESESLSSVGDNEKNAKGRKEGRLIEAEERQTGQLKGSVFLALMVAMGGPWLLGLLAACLALTQAARIATDLWLTSWTENRYPQLWKNGYIATYIGLSVAQALLLYAFCFLVALSNVSAARRLHDGALSRVLRTPIWFFDTNPLGRILNRFSRDQDGIDNSLSESVRQFCIQISIAVGTFALVCYATSGWFLLGLAPLLGVYYFIQEIYRRTARELKRLDALTR